MSADDGFILRINTDGKYILQYYFASEDNLPDIDDPGAKIFSSLGEAMGEYQKIESEHPSEYGLRVNINSPTFSRKTNNQETDSKMLETRKFVRKPFYVDVADVTADNMEAVALWCGGDVQFIDKADGTKIPYVSVKVNRPLNPRQTQAFPGDRVLHTETGFKVYTDKAFLASFELSSPEVNVVTGPPPIVVPEGRVDSEKRVAAKKKAANRVLANRPGVVKKVTPAPKPGPVAKILPAPALERVVDASGETVGVVEESATQPLDNVQETQTSVIEEVVKSPTVVDFFVEENREVRPREVITDNVPR